MLKFHPVTCDHSDGKRAVRSKMDPNPRMTRQVPVVDGQPHLKGEAIDAQLSKRHRSRMDRSVLQFTRHIKVLIKRDEHRHQTRQQQKKPAVGLTGKATPAKPDHQCNGDEYHYKRHV